MSGWDLLDEPEPEPEPEPPGQNSSVWASLDDERAEGPVEFDDLDDEAPEDAWPSLDPVAGPPEPAQPAPEVVASQLVDGEVLWARADGTDVILGSGQPLHVPGGVPDGIGGWRRVRVVDAASLRAEVLPLPVARPAQHVGDDPVTVFGPGTDPAPPVPDRPPGFPVGQGGDLSAAFEARVERAEELRRAEIRAARDDYERRADQMKQNLTDELQRRTRAIEERAEARIRDVAGKIRADADAELADSRHRVGRYRDERLAAERDREAAIRARDAVIGARDRAVMGRLIAGAVAVLGWFVVLVLLVL